MTRVDSEPAELWAPDAEERVRRTGRVGSGAFPAGMDEDDDGVCDLRFLP